VKRGRHQSFDRSPQRGRPVGHDLDRFAVCTERAGEKSSSCPEIASGGDEHVDDLAVLVDGPIHVAPLAGDFDVGLVDEPTVSGRVPARAGRIREERGEALDPAEDGDVVDLDPALSEEFFDVAIGEPVPQVPADGEDDDLGREPEPDERRARNDGDRTGTTRPHRHTTTADRDPRPMQQSPAAVAIPLRFWLELQM